MGGRGFLAYIAGASLSVASLGCFGIACDSRGANVAAAPRALDGAPHVAAAVDAPSAGGSSAGAIQDAGPPPPPPYAFDDGDDDADDPEDLPHEKLGTHLALTKVGTAPYALTRICDLTAFKGSLYAAHSNQPLGSDGATITRYTRDTGNVGKFSIAFDWNRPGEPTKGGGAGQGFLRVHKFGGRLFVADADPPYNGLAMVEYGTEGYVFVSDENGTFARARMPGYKPPLAPDANGKAGASVLPRAYHVIDVARFGGEFFASTGSVPPTERAWNGPSPGALHRARPDLTRFVYDVDYPFPYQNGVWRLTYMTRFHGRLYAGIQDYDGREPNDYVYFTPDSTDADGGAPGKSVGDLGDAGADRLAQNRTRMKAFRVSDSGAAETLRWRVDPRTHTLYWIAWTRDGVNLRATRDGDTWETIELPASAGRPSDIRRFGDDLVVMTERALLSLGPDGKTTELLHVDGKKTPFEVSDFFCTAPLGIYKGQLYVGGQRGGTLYRVEQVPDSAPTDGGARDAGAP